MQSSVALPDALREFIDSSQWTFAKTMPDWHHEYIVRERVDEELFVQLVRHIRANGYKGKFYQESITYYDDGGLIYWTMGAPLEETTIINRCKKENSYEYRLLKGTLPELKRYPKGLETRAHWQRYTLSFHSVSRTMTRAVMGCDVQQLAP